MNVEHSVWGIAGLQALPWNVARWVDGKGQPQTPVRLQDLSGRWKVLFCFQSWCPGCHSFGLPALRDLVESLQGNTQIALLAVQTVFEGFETNTYEAMLKFQAESDLPIPFGHDPGDEASGNRSNIMWHYRSGGTPWFIIIDPKDHVVFNGFHIDAAKAVDYLRHATNGDA